ncbi:MAG: (2Fe-2S)-binding protein [Proteobacteria bacterium]|uniref:(2Fe-2S)-binding protein n=1 Tax=Aquabacterium sp. TaxID=1872578 RepID=UPI0035C741AA|nr:(2Fe-2S)-binding protein [Pseudomonadota bacterium]
MHQFQLNGRPVQVDVEDDMPLLWVLRDELGHTGTKFGCGIAACGACTVHLNGAAVRSCVMPISAVAGQSVQTIESQDDAILTKLQATWVQHQVPQCGYCQSGMLMAATALLRQNPTPSDEDIDAAMTNICRCGTYQRVRAAIHTAAGAAPGKKGAA